MTHEIARVFDAEACKCGKKISKSGLSKASRIILDTLTRHGISSKTILELGCGVGGLSMELLRNGAASVQGIDLSPRMIAQARDRALSEGFDERADFTVGDAAKIDLDPSYIVILDKVICCYPEMGALLENSLKACLGYYCVSLPRDKGAWGILQRLSIALESAYRWLTRCGFRSYLHSTDEVDRRVRRNGYDRVLCQTTGPWLITMYRKLSS
ncbi:MAG: class I SAM-dependent methyltransferase [Candidatus Geothermarchaeales archaeon]